MIGGDWGRGIIQYLILVWFPVMLELVDGVDTDLRATSAKNVA